ncbi:MAG: hypothetical protein JNM78_06695 [Cyclobacteriaceae bacterium]|nr:hypothetical protein [Cyclobacteriaceae bacterium]
MKKLEDIPKKNIFEVPEGYFEKLPGIIQARVTKPEPVAVRVWVISLKYALPLIAAMAVGIFWFSNQSEKSFNEQLASIQTEQLIAYLNDADLQIDNLSETVTWDEIDLIELEEKVYSSFEITGAELDLLLEEFKEPENF